MMHPTGALPNEAYADGLRRADGDVVRQIYTEFRPAVLRSVAPEGGAGSAVFQAAVVEAARLADAGRLPAGEPFFYVLKNLAAQFHALRQGGGALPDLDSDDAEAPPTDPVSPDELRETWQKISAWTSDPAVAAAESSLPAAVWRKTQALEKRLADGLPLLPPAEPAINRGWRFAWLTLATLTLGYALYAWWTRPRPPENVFEANFNPPESFVADRALRYDNDSARVESAECDRLMRESDRLYQAGRFEEAQEPLLLVVLDSTATCQSDAWYFLSLLRLKLGDPQTAIDCLTKIEDYDHFGEDIQWQMALAFVQLAEQNPDLRDKARRALDKIITSPQPETRQAQARAMLEKLGD